MNRYGICWFYSRATYMPLFVWRDRDQQHPAHLFGCELANGQPLWWKFTKDQLYGCARVSSSWPKAAIQYTADQQAKIGIRRLVQHAGWLEREIQKHGYSFTPPLERIAS